MFDTEQTKSYIAANIAALMETYGLSQTELAKRAKVNQVFISRLLYKVMIPNVIDFANVAEVLGTTVDALMQKPNTKKTSKKLSRSA